MISAIGDTMPNWSPHDVAGRLRIAELEERMAAETEELARRRRGKCSNGPSGSRLFIGDWPPISMSFRGTSHPQAPRKIKLPHGSKRLAVVPAPYRYDGAD